MYRAGPNAFRTDSDRNYMWGKGVLIETENGAPQSGHCIDSIYGCHLCLEFSQETVKKDGHEPLSVQWPHLCSSLMVLDRFGCYVERPQGERPQRQKVLGSNPGSSLTACLVLSTFLNLDPPHSRICEARVDASVYSSRFLWELNVVNFRQ